MKFISSTLLLLTVCTVINAQQIDCVYHFDNDIDVLNDDQFKDAENWAASHYHFRHDVLEIRGHTDQDADDAYNEALSMRRARHLESIFKRVGFDNVRLSYYGEKVPLCQENDEACQAKNRRVEVILYNTFEDKWMATADLEAPEVFFFDAGKPMTIEGERGTTIYVGLGSLKTSDGKPFFGKVRVELREILNPLDCIKSGISTTSNGALLETGGMCELQMFSTSNNAKLELNAPIDIQFPSQRDGLESDMRTFEGKPTAMSVDWEAVNWPVEAYDLKWYSVRRIKQNKSSEWYPSGFGVPGTERQPDTTYVYKCDTIRLTKEQVAEKKQRMSRGAKLAASIRVQNLGWINCDRFLGNKDAITLNVVADVEMEFVYVILDDKRVALSYGLFPQTKIPKNEPVTIVSMGAAADDGLIPFSIIKTISSGEKIQVESEFITKQEIDRRMEVLSSLWSS
jgi:hypothetical protein